MDRNIKYSEEEIKTLMNYIDKGQERINEAKRIVSNATCDFDIWRKYSIPEERSRYTSILGINSPIRTLINNHMMWMLDEEYKEKVVDLEYLIESINILFEQGKISCDEVDILKNEIKRLNFGFMILRW